MPHRSRRAYYTTMLMSFPQTPLQRVNTLKLPELLARDAVETIHHTGPGIHLWRFEPWALQPVQVSGGETGKALRMVFGVRANFPFMRKELAPGYWLTELQEPITELMRYEFDKVLQWQWREGEVHPDPKISMGPMF